MCLTEKLMKLISGGLRGIETILVTLCSKCLSLNEFYLNQSVMGNSHPEWIYTLLADGILDKTPKLYRGMVPLAGVEPAHCNQRGILNPLCLPISPQRHYCGGVSRSRTGLDGFAIRYITALLTRLILERETRLELATLTLARLCSTN
jgi:hypothetical protein